MPTPKANPGATRGIPLPGASQVQTSSRPGPLGLVWRAVGGALYTLGFAAEYQLVQTGRVLREAGILLGQMLGALGLWLAALAVGVVRSLGQELAAPFVRLQKRRAQLRRVRQRARQRRAGLSGSTLAGSRLKSSVQFVVGIGGILMPVAAAVVLAFTVYTITSMQVALAVEVDGKVLGYVQDQGVVESAKSLLRERIRLAEHQNVQDWQLNPTYTIASVPRTTTAGQLANAILRNGQTGTDLVEATGVYLDGSLFAVTRDGARVRQYLDELLAAQRQNAPEGAEVRFVRSVECEPDNDDIFFASSVEDADALLKALAQNAVEAETMTANGEESLGEIALANNLILEDIHARNPELAAEDADFVPAAGSEILLRRAQPLLQVQTLFMDRYEEPIPYATEEVQNDQLPRGTRRRVQQGQEGVQAVVDQLVYIDGELVQRARQDAETQVLAAPVNEVIEVGTMEVSFSGGMGGGAGIGSGYVFPVPGMTGSSRGFIPGVHRGLDLNAPAGTPIFAAQGGTVVAAGWHFSWGYYVEIAHPGGVNSLYAHCSALYVSAGQTVGQGQHIAAVGSTGNSSGNHLHLEMTVGGALVDPRAFVG